MIVFLILVGFFLFLFFLTWIPVRLEVRFQEAFFLKIKYLFLTFPVLPEREREEKPQKEEPPPEADKAGEMGKKLKLLIKREGFWGFLQSLLEFVKLLGTCSRRLLSHVKLKNFDLYLCTAGAGDAAEAAILYGELSAAVYSACGVLFGLLPCKKKAVSVDLDYHAEENHVDFSGKISILPFFVLKEGIVLLIKGFPFIKKFK